MDLLNTDTKPRGFMDLLNKTTETVTEVTYTLQHPKEGVIVYKEWLNTKGHIVDSTIRSKDGYEIDDPILTAELWDYIDSIENK